MTGGSLRLSHRYSSGCNLFPFFLSSTLFVLFIFFQVLPCFLACSFPGTREHRNLKDRERPPLPSPTRCLLNVLSSPHITIPHIVIYTYITHIIIDGSYISHSSHHSSHHCVLCRICVVQVQPRKHVCARSTWITWFAPGNA